jgi:predicted nucleic acid-binding Zn ribbon protein
MDAERTQKYLESLLNRTGANGVGELVPLVSRWHELLASIPGLQNRRPGSHCRVAGLTGGVLSVEADHPAWMQLLQWHEGELLQTIASSFPVLKVRAVQFRLSKPGRPVEKPTVVMPDPVKPVLEPGEQERLDALLDEMEGLIRKNRGKQNPV